MSTQPLVAYSLGLIGIILVKTLAPAFYARQDIHTRENRHRRADRHA